MTKIRDIEKAGATNWPAFSLQHLTKFLNNAENQPLYHNPSKTNKLWILKKSMNLL